MLKFKNDGQPNVLSSDAYSQMTDEEILKMATTYSEGNEGLKKLLIYCAKNKIPTFASCGGHPEKLKNNAPYIGFTLDSSETISTLSKLFEMNLNSDMHFLFHKFDNNLLLSIHVNNTNSATAFTKIQNDIENQKSIPENNLFKKLAYLLYRSPDSFQYLISCDANIITHSNIPFLSIYIDKEKYNYPTDTKKDPYTTVNTLVDSLIQKADCGQDLHGYLKLYNMKEFCKGVPHMGMNLLNTVMQKVKSLTNTKDNERNDKEWTQ